MEPPARVLPDLPWDIVERVAVSSCRAGGLREWCSTWRATCRAFADTSWFERNVRGGVGLAVVPSEAYPTVQAGVSRARAASRAAVAAAVAITAGGAAAGAVAVAPPASLVFSSRARRSPF